MHHCYEDISTIKPLQYAGSISSNLLLRLRYGTCMDILYIPILLAAIFLRKEKFLGAKAMAFRAIKKLFKSYVRMRLPKGNNAHPFRRFDYTETRGGAKYSFAPCQQENSLRPLVSVIVRTYQGRCFFLRQAMQCVFNQTYPNLELIITEDGGTAAKLLVEQMSSQAPEGVKVVYLSNAKVGRSAAGNAGARASQGQYLMFFDDDDLLYADHVEALAHALDAAPDTVVSYAPGDALYTETFTTSYKETLRIRDYSLFQPWSYADLCKKNFLLMHALFHRSLFEDRGGFDESITYLEDWNLWLKFASRNTFVYVPKTTSLFRIPARHTLRAMRAVSFSHAGTHACKDIWQ